MGVGDHGHIWHLAAHAPADELTPAREDGQPCQEEEEPESVELKRNNKLARAEAFPEEWKRKY